MSEAFAQIEIDVETEGRGFYDITARIRAAVRESGVRAGLCHAMVLHTSASLVIQENADPAVMRDLGRWLDRLAPESGSYEHADEGPDDMPAHLRSAITRSSETLPVQNGDLWLGTWQGVYVCEHRRMRHRRKIALTIVGR